jgi:hypothetical protein
MTIPKMNSQGLNNILVKAQAGIAEVNSKIDNIKNDIQTKMSITDYIIGYISNQIEFTSLHAFNKDVFTKVFARDCSGQFESYGSTIHPGFIKAPINLFNLKISGSGNIFFRNDVKVKVNGIVNKVGEPNYENILKHDSIKDKEVLFHAFEQRDVEFEVYIDKNLLGSSKFNMIEIDSFLPGSYDIVDILVYENAASDVSVSYGKVVKAGKQRIVLPNKVNLSRVVFKLKLNHEVMVGDKKIYPFGFKHIYFYDADFKIDSYAIATITANAPIAIIKDSIGIIKPSGPYMSEIKDNDIHVYMDNVNGTLETEIYPSTPTQRNELARNTNTVYAKIPINTAYIGMSFEVETRG